VNTCKPDGLLQDQQAPKKTRRRGLVSELPFLVTEVRMPTLTVAIPSSLDAEVHDTAARRGTSLDAIVNAALGEYLSSQHHGLYQISTSAALVGGAAAGAVSSRTLLEHGDFGLGTFENLDGEMVILNGAIYQVRGDGSIKHREDGFQIPFAAVTRFQEEESFDSQAIRCLKDLELVCDPHRETANLFYALKIDGFFETVHARAVSGIAPGTKLVDAAKEQKEFHFSNIEGTLVCLWSPSYSSAFNVPGYHFHFISKDRTKGGHVLDCSARTLRVGLQMLSEYDVRLPDHGSFLTTDLSNDPAAVLQKVE
jgi:acetolactate decarboxylase